MIEKMKFLSITGPKKDIDRVAGKYLCKYEIQIENALSELKTVKNLRPYIEINPYKDAYLKAGRLAANFPEPAGADCAPVTAEEAVAIVSEAEAALSAPWARKDSLRQEMGVTQTSYDKILPFRELNYDIRAILQFQHIRFRFGRIPREYYPKFESNAYGSLDTILYTCQEDESYVSVVYFVPAVISKQVDAIYASMHFERLIIPDEYNGTPDEAIAGLQKHLETLQSEMSRTEQEITSLLEDRRQAILNAYAKLKSYSTNFNVRKLAACTSHEINTFYILCGWMTEQDADAFQKELREDEQTFCFVEDDHNNLLSGPPTKLRNPGLFRPFELFIRMYGVPSYQELDPTILIGLTYSFLFGFMFGDAGQGLVLILGGLVLYRLKKLDLAAVIACCGFFSTIFGFLYGSVFGFEDIIRPLWLRPAEQMINLPFIGKLNTVFVVAVALGMGIIVLTMLLNIYNSIRCHDPEAALLTNNGAAGLVFYGSVLASILLFMTGRALPAAAVLIVMFGLPLLIIFFKEPITRLITGNRKQESESPVMFFIQGFFELFELLLSYFSNTLSFVRVGAFAVSHTAMMEVVLMLAGAEAGGSPNWIVVILGNVIVCAMEGLIVGIQVLRLEYYEIFSRFYKGSGREFRPYGKA